MNLLLLVIILYVCSTDAIYTSNSKRLEDLSEYGKTWMYFPDGNGLPQIVQLTAQKQKEFFSPIDNFVTFHLYNRDTLNQSEIIQVANATSYKSSNYKSDLNTKIVIHGWRSSVQSNFCQTTKDTFLKEEDCNVIVVDWHDIASNVIYPIPAMQTKSVGAHVAQMIQGLIGPSATKNVHLIGHSLGAHIAGFAGSAYQQNLNNKLARITGLDPALPGFELIVGDANKLDASDAEFVDVIHTCAGILGHYAPLGHADFYPNGGLPMQPGCFGLPQMLQACSHGRAWQYFAQSVPSSSRARFLATQCESWATFKEGKCRNNTQVPMGEPLPATTRGLFYLRTDNDSPLE